MKPTFPGFAPDALEFFLQLEQNNNRDWFQPRKEHYERLVRAPMEQLVQAVNTGLMRFAPNYVTDPKKAVFRIYRDTRFSPDKTPYKTHIAATFGRRGVEKTNTGGYYFAISHKSVEIAGGVYHPEPPTLLAIRTHIANTHHQFRDLLATRKLKKLLGDLQGDELSRVPKGFQTDHPAADLLRKKDWVFFATLGPDVACSRALLAEILSRFEVVAPVIDYLNTPLRSKKAQKQWA